MVQGAVKRNVYLPEGKWKSGQGESYIGGECMEIPCDVNDLLWFEREEEWNHV
jgi:hypothetical protein